MSNHNSKLSQEKFLNHLIEVISESIENNEDLLREALIEEGLSYDALVSEGTDLIKSIEKVMEKGE